MAEAKLALNRRVPDEARLKWGRELAAKVGDRLPRGWSEVYAFEAIDLHNNPTAELKLQAIRIGDLGITALPDEVYGITGLKLKGRSPLQPTFNIELANGAEGYIHLRSNINSEAIPPGPQRQPDWRSKQNRRSLRLC